MTIITDSEQRFSYFKNKTLVDQILDIFSILISVQKNSESYFWFI